MKLWLEIAANVSAATAIVSLGLAVAAGLIGPMDGWSLLKIGAGALMIWFALTLLRRVPR